MGRGPTDLEQKMGLSPDLLASMTDKRCPRFGETSYNENPGRSRAMMVTPSTRSWNEFSAFIEEWDELRTGA